METSYLYHGVPIHNDAELDAAITAWYVMTDAERRSNDAAEIIRAMVVLHTA